MPEDDEGVPMDVTKQTWTYGINSHLRDVEIDLTKIELQNKFGTDFVGLCGSHDIVPHPSLSKFANYDDEEINE